MPDSFFPSASEILRILPEITLTVTATLIMVLSVLVRERSKHLLGYVSLLGLLAALAGSAV